MTRASITDFRTIAPAKPAREHHWDALRALLMLLGIPYHVAMAYRLDAGWIVNSGEGAMALNHLAQIIHIFRMPAFFLIAGYFAALLLARRTPFEWLEGRARRLTVPLIAALLTLNPLLNLLCELSNFGWREALASWEHESTTSGGYWVRHLWFLIVLLYLSAGAALFCRLAPRLRIAELPARIDDWAARHVALTVLGAALLIGLWEGAAIELFYMGGYATNLLQQILRLDQLIEFAPWFLVGALVARAPAFRAALYRLSPTLLIVAIGATTLDLVLRDQLWAPYGRFLDTVAALALTQILIATIRRIGSRPSRLVQELVAASFVIYLFHLPILVGLVVLAKGLAIPLALKAGGIMVLTLALSFAIWLLVKRSPLLRFLYDGSWPSRPAARKPALATNRLSPSS